MQENVSPEEKLLNLIKKGEGTAKVSSPEKQKPEESKIERSNTKDEEQKPGKEVKKASVIPKKIEGKARKSYSVLNKFLIITILFAVSYMIYSHLFVYKPKFKITEAGEVSEGEKTVGETPKQLSPLQAYTDVLNSRQMFKIYEVQKPKPAGPPKPKVTLQQLLGGYTFVGIIFGDVPQAIVEERRSGQSFYLTAGQYLGEMKIEKIESGKITVSYEDEVLDINI